MIPKQHVADIFFEYNDEAMKSEGRRSIKQPDGRAYQSVFPFHVHLIPRYSKEDDFSIHFGNHQEDYSAEAMQEIAETIAKQVN